MKGMHGMAEKELTNPYCALYEYTGRIMGYKKK